MQTASIQKNRVGVMLAAGRSPRMLLEGKQWDNKSFGAQDEAAMSATALLTDGSKHGSGCAPRVACSTSGICDCAAFDAETETLETLLGKDCRPDNILVKQGCTKTQHGTNPLILVAV